MSSITPIVFIGGLYGQTQAAYDATLRTGKPHNVNEFWTGHLPKGTPFLTTQWNRTPVGGTFNPNRPNARAVADLIIANYANAKRVKLACHSYGSRVGLAVAEILIAAGWSIPLVALFDPVDYALANRVNDIGLIAPAGIGSVLCLHRMPANEVPFSTFVSTAIIPASGRTMIENISYPMRPGQSVDAAHARYVWDVPTIQRVGAA